MIGHCWQLIHKFIQQIYGAKAFSTFFLVLNITQNQIINQSKQMVEQLLYIFHHFFISCDFYLLTSYEPSNCNLRCIKVRFLSQNQFYLFYQLISQ